MDRVARTFRAGSFHQIRQWGRSTCRHVSGSHGSPRDTSNPLAPFGRSSRLSERRGTRMTHRMQGAIVLLALAQGLAGCDSSRSSIPSAPTPTAPSPGTPASSNLMVFIDTASGFSTSDVHDAQDQMVQFSRAGELIWTADGTRFPGWGGDYAYLK